MAYPRKPPDAEAMFELTSSNFEGKPKEIFFGYRPIYDVRSDYWTSANHEFIDVSSVSTGQSARAYVWFISPEHYPNSLWAGRVLNVAEGSRVVGSSTALKVLNPSLLQNGG